MEFLWLNTPMTLLPLSCPPPQKNQEKPREKKKRKKETYHPPFNLFKSVSHANQSQIRKLNLADRSALNICRISTWKVQKSVFIMKFVKATCFQFGIFFLMKSFFSSSQLCSPHCYNSVLWKSEGQMSCSLTILNGCRGFWILVSHSAYVVCLKYFDIS